MDKLINRITWFASRCQQAFSKPCLANLISKDTNLVYSRPISRQASRCQQATSKPCLVNLISKDTHLVFSIFKVDLVAYEKENLTYVLLVNSSLKSDNMLGKHRLLSFSPKSFNKFYN